MTLASRAHLIPACANDADPDEVRAALLAETGRHWFPRGGLKQRPWQLEAVLARETDPTEPVLVIVGPGGGALGGAEWFVDFDFIDGSTHTDHAEDLPAIVSRIRQRALGLHDLGPDPYRAARILHTAGHERLSSWLAELTSWRASAAQLDELPGVRQRLKLTEAALAAAVAYTDEVFDLVAMSCQDLSRERVARIAAKAGAERDARRPLLRLADLDRFEPRPHAAEEAQGRVRVAKAPVSE